MNTISYSPSAPQALPVDEGYPKISPPSQGTDSSEYLCGNAGPAFEGANPGRDQDRSRQDECNYAHYSYGGAQSSGSSDTDATGGF